LMVAPTEGEKEAEMNYQRRLDPDQWSKQRREEARKRSLWTLVDIEVEDPPPALRSPRVFHPTQ
jgi:hypothetical protein